MAIQIRTLLKSWFETRDRPTQAQFGDLIDSFAHKTDDAATILQKVTAPATPTSTGTVGQFATGDGYLYLCTETDVWIRVPLATWTP